MTQQNPIVKQLVDANDKILTMNEVAEMLGITTSGVRKRIMRGTLPSHKQGRKRYVLMSELVSDIRKST